LEADNIIIPGGEKAPSVCKEISSDIKHRYEILDRMAPEYLITKVMST